jgi:hypothetical protein
MTASLEELDYTLRQLEGRKYRFSNYYFLSFNIVILVINKN